ncbi:hypothetical protein WJX72_000030 [[Myrmecia] bisecta]|uniref:Uncharacterized protein n=1 Tax=[Myrmecia] bisecta TaxID=41462 RepID=A0AAW1R4L3_9CHLO
MDTGSGKSKDSTPAPQVVAVKPPSVMAASSQNDKLVLTPTTPQVVSVAVTKSSTAPTAEAEATRARHNEAEAAALGGSAMDAEALGVPEDAADKAAELAVQAKEAARKAAAAAYDTVAGVADKAAHSKRMQGTPGPVVHVDYGADMAPEAQEDLTNLDTIPAGSLEEEIFEDSFPTGPRGYV